ncbi:hypothetical protein L7F22_024901 [Adiantum nelumboides]|nr:hypothetical protein [Adiantum nelumboides]
MPTQRVLLQMPGTTSTICIHQAPQSMIRIGPKGRVVELIVGSSPSPAALLRVSDHQHYQLIILIRNRIYFLITERINDVSFRLRLPDTWKIHNAFHVSLLKPFRGDVPDDGEPDEQPEVEENEEILVLEQILAHKDTKTKGKARRRFLVKFKNYPALDAKWMEEEDLADTPQIVKLYLEAFGLA